MFISAGVTEVFAFSKPIGVGLIQSAINLTKLCLLQRPTSLTFIGSAGSYDATKYQIFDIVHTSAAAQIESSLLKKESYTIIEQIISLNPNDVIVNSSNYITTDPTTALAFSKFGFYLENMEFYSVLQVAKEFAIPAKGIFVVTNYCTPDAHQQYKQNIAHAKELLIHEIKSHY
ncbi:MAG: purine-nucleoside phosphorylase [Epsilonproteobacteria bacterium]|nr:purine-nucleoside phosphorylase [Campylobacterota bacterium]